MNRLPPSLSCILLVDTRSGDSTVQEDKIQLQWSVKEGRN